MVGAESGLSSGEGAATWGEHRIMTVSSPIPQSLGALAVILLSVMLTACGKNGSTGGGSDSQVEVRPRVPDKDFALNRQWVETMLEENEEALKKMRDRLDALRRELDRLETAGTPEETEGARRRLHELLDDEETDLARMREYAESMHEALQGQE